MILGWYLHNYTIINSLNICSLGGSIRGVSFEASTYNTDNVWMDIMPKSDIELSVEVQI